MKTCTVNSVEQMKANSARVTELIKSRSVSFVKEVEDEIWARQEAEDKYLSGFEWAAGV